MTESKPRESPETPPEIPLSVDSEGWLQGPEGLAGWLIVVGLGLIVAPMLLGARMLEAFVPLFTEGTWQALTTRGSPDYSALWAPLLIFKLIVTVGLISAQCFLLFLFLQKSRTFPKTYIVVAIIVPCFIVLEAWFSTFVSPDKPMFAPDTAREFSGTLFWAAIWVPYMMISERVRNTFVE